jgi:hypothetical protein
MKTKILLCLALVLSGVIGGCAMRQNFPPIEAAESHFPSGSPSGSNEWYGHTFRQLIPPLEAKQILLLDDNPRHDPSLPRPSSQEIQDYYNALLNHLELSNQKAGRTGVSDIEGVSAEIAVVTTAGNIIRLQAIGFGRLGSISSVSVSGPGMATGMNVAGFPPASRAANAELIAAGGLPSVKTDYVLDQNPGNWAGRRFAQIIQPGKIKRIILLDEDMIIFGRFVETPKLHRQLLGHYYYDRPFAPPPAILAAIEQEEHQLGYGKLLERFEACDEKAEMIHSAGNEHPLAKLIFMTDSGKVMYLEFLGDGDRITGVIIHGPRQGVRISLSVFPFESSGRGTN